MVWTSEIAGNENQHELAVDSRHSVLLGHRLARIYVPSTGQPDRIPRKRRPVHLGAAKSDSGGYFTGSLYRYRHVHVQERVISVESCGGVRVLGAGGIFCVQVKSGFVPVFYLIKCFITLAVRFIEKC